MRTFQSHIQNNDIYEKELQFCTRTSPKMATSHAVNGVQLTVGNVKGVADRS